MANDLQSTITSLANQFASGILDAIRNASLDEILGAGKPAAAPRAKGRPARAPRAAAAPAGRTKAAPTKALGRRSSEEIEATVSRIVDALKGKKEGLRSEQIQAALGLAKNEIPRPLAKALNEGLIKKKGEKRATTYFAK